MIHPCTLSTEFRCELRTVVKHFVVSLMLSLSKENKLLLRQAFLPILTIYPLISNFAMEFYQGIRYLILTGMLVALAVTSYDGIKAVKNKVTG